MNYWMNLCRYLSGLKHFKSNRKTGVFSYMWNYHQRVLKGKNRINNRALVANRRLNLQTGTHPTMWTFTANLKKKINLNITLLMNSLSQISEKVKNISKHRKTYKKVNQ